MFLEYQSIYSCFLSKITDKKILKYSEEDFEEIALDYLHNTIAITYIRNLFQEITFDDLLKTIEFKLIKSIDKISDENFVKNTIAEGMVIQWMNQNLDTDLSLAVIIGGKEEKMLKNDYKANLSRLNDLEKKLQKSVRNYGYYNGKYSEK